MTARLYRLIEMHQRIDERLRVEMIARAPDPMKLTRLKKMRLRVKDLIHRHMPGVASRFTPTFALRPIMG